MPSPPLLKLNLGTCTFETGSRGTGNPPFFGSSLPFPPTRPSTLYSLSNTCNCGAAHPGGAPALLCLRSLDPSTQPYSRLLSQLTLAIPTPLCFQRLPLVHQLLPVNIAPPRPPPRIAFLGRNTLGGTRSSPATLHSCPSPIILISALRDAAALQRFADSR